MSTTICDGCDLNQPDVHCNYAKSYAVPSSNVTTEYQNCLVCLVYIGIVLLSCTGFSRSLKQAKKLRSVRSYKVIQHRFGMYNKCNIFYQHQMMEARICQGFLFMIDIRV